MTNQIKNKEDICKSCGHKRSNHYKSKEPTGYIYFCHDFSKSKYCACSEFKDDKSN